ncbi:MAG: OmpA family protein [bacterium]|nr:OmpA family protein [bacterium]
MYGRLTARIITATLLLLTISLSAVAAETDYKYSLSVRGGLANLGSGEQGPYPLQSSYSVALGYYPSPKWHVAIDFTRYRLYNDTSASSSFAIGRDDQHDTLRFSSSRLGVTAQRDLFVLGEMISFSLGLGGGLIIWEVTNPLDETIVKVDGEKDQLLDYKATEIFVGLNSELQLKLSERVSLFGKAEMDFLTGAGVEFSREIESARDRQLFSTFLGLRISFGTPAQQWKSEGLWTENASGASNQKKELDSDGDNVPNARDRCPDSRPGSLVNDEGCPTDSDGDGVTDGFDNCPGSDRRAIGMVDINGCPVDSDFDGVPDYLDQCPYNTVGAIVDAQGCPVDSDADGIPDGLDDCPHTLVGVDVDKFGCIDLGMLAKPMVLYIDYVSGSFEIDHATKGKLDRLSRLLNFVEDVRLEISGYTDNIGTTVANKELSLKRARRVRDYLMNLGIAAERMEALGRGESNFLASNDTAAGRAKNRRVEIIFHR